ncbi:hypothetical protein KC992_03490 [Candidatus Saccharibacteria bacterium]|nr:hypothetical protein [Candidatus Saccharibacteria bacterium]MCA9328628.1 hypothetical protein [Candidatus Saccharibacteria bacterium]
MKRGDFQELGLVFPFPDSTQYAVGPDLASSVQFIGAAVSHAESGQTETVLQQLDSFPDRAFVRNVAMYLFGSTRKLEYLDYAEAAPYPNDTGSKMRPLSRSAIQHYFAGEVQLPDDGAHTPTDEDIRQVRENVWGHMTSIRVALQAAGGQSVAALKVDYDNETRVSIQKLAQVGDFEVARDLATGCFTPYGGLRARETHDEAVVGVIGRAKSPAELWGLEALTRTCFETFGSFEARQIYDKTALKFVGKCIATGDLATAAELHRRMLTSSGKSLSARMLQACQV